MFKRNLFMFDANAGGGGGNGETGTGNQAGSEGSTQTALTFEAWHDALPEEQKGLIEDHTKGLKTALESERGSRKDLEKQLRDMAKKSEKGSESEAQLTKLADDLSASDRKADFYEAAHIAGVKNLKLAFTVAATDEMFDKHGRVNFDEMKKTYPELFASATTTRGDAGSGTNTNHTQAETMDDFIRAKVGGKK